MSPPKTMRAMVTMGHGDLDQMVLHEAACSSLIVCSCIAFWSNWFAMKYFNM